MSAPSLHRESTDSLIRVTMQKSGAQMPDWNDVCVSHDQVTMILLVIIPEEIIICCTLVLL